MKKNELAAKKLKKLRLSRETLHALTSADTRNVVGGVEETNDCQGTSPFRGSCVSTIGTW